MSWKVHSLQTEKKTWLPSVTRTCQNYKHLFKSYAPIQCCNIVSVLTKIWKKEKTHLAHKFRVGILKSYQSSLNDKGINVRYLLYQKQHNKE